MTKLKKFNLKRVLVIIIAALILFSAISLAATKIIYDSIFVRYDEKVEIPYELSQIVSARETTSYPSGDVTLKGYLYRAESELSKDALIILAPGFNACADSYIRQIDSLLKGGWSVFAFDPTGCGRSGGESTVGFAQEALDLEETIKYVESCSRFGYNDIVLLGHSRGGYAACLMLSQGYDISAAISISGVNSSMEAVMNSAEDKIGPIAYLNYGFLWSYQSLIFGPQTVNLTADEVIDSCDTPVLIIHGKQDSELPTDKYSIYSYKSEIENPKVDFELVDGGHTDLLFSKSGGASEITMSKIDEFLRVSLS